MSVSNPSTNMLVIQQVFALKRFCHENISPEVFETTLCVNAATSNGQDILSKT